MVEAAAWRKWWGGEIQDGGSNSFCTTRVRDPLCPPPTRSVPKTVKIQGLGSGINSRTKVQRKSGDTQGAEFARQCTSECSCGSSDPSCGCTQYYFECDVNVDVDFHAQ